MRLNRRFRTRHDRTCPVDSATLATVSGTVSFYGVPPQLVKIDMSNDPACQGDNQSEQVLTDDGRLANVLIYVKDGLGTRAFDSPSQLLVVKQHGCRYAPHVAAVMVGQPVDFSRRRPNLAQHPSQPKEQPGVEPVADAQFRPHSIRLFATLRS